MKHFFKRLAHAYCSKFQNENKMFTFNFKSSLFDNWILILTRRILDKNVLQLFCTSEIKNPAFRWVFSLSYLICAWSIGHFDQSFCKKLKTNHKSTNEKNNKLMLGKSGSRCCTICIDRYQTGIAAQENGQNLGVSVNLKRLLMNIL